MRRSRRMASLWRRKSALDWSISSRSSSARALLSAPAEECPGGSIATDRRSCSISQSSVERNCTQESHRWRTNVRISLAVPLGVRHTTSPQVLAVCTGNLDPVFDTVVHGTYVSPGREPTCKRIRSETSGGSCSIGARRRTLNHLLPRHGQPSRHLRRSQLPNPHWRLILRSFHRRHPHDSSPPAMWLLRRRVGRVES